ncbi:MAG: LytR/AlgR family response regulator transcription factor [Flavobacteriales bacterium]
MTKQRVFIVDDEPLAIQEMKWMLKDFSDIDIVGQASTAIEAIRQINTVKPDLIFLDINIPEKNGFDILNELNYFPQIIFVTAYDEYALKAFEINAIDYLMKPLGQERLVKALSKVKASGQTSFSRVFIKEGNEMKFIEADSIIWIDSIGNYIRIHHEEGSNMMYKSLTAIEEQLKYEMFFRANRQELVNMNKMDRVVKKVDNWIVVMKDGKEIQLSKRQSARFIAMNKTIEI